MTNQVREDSLLITETANETKKPIKNWQFCVYESSLTLIGVITYITLGLGLFYGLGASLALILGKMDGTTGDNAFTAMVYSGLIIMGLYGLVMSIAIIIGIGFIVYHVGHWIYHAKCSWWCQEYKELK